MPATLEVREAGVDVPRDEHGPLNPVTGLRERALLVEPERDFCCLQTEALDTSPWVQAGTITLTGGQDDPKGGTAAWLLDAGSTDADVHQLLSVQRDNQGAGLSFWIREGTSAKTKLRCRDLDAPATWLEADITWLDGEPQVNVITGSQQGDPEAYVDGSWRVELIGSGGLTQANDNLLEIFPDPDAGTGTVTIFGPQVEQSRFQGGAPTSYLALGASTATRPQDDVEVPAESATIQTITLYALYTLVNSSSGVRFYYGSYGSNPQLWLSGREVRLTNSAGELLRGLVSNVDELAGDRIETLIQLRDDGTNLYLTHIRSINGGAEESSGEDGPVARDAAWPEAIWWLRDPFRVRRGIAWIALADQPGLHSMDDMRTYAGVD